MRYTADMVDTSLVTKTASSTARDTFRMARDAATRANASSSSDGMLQAGVDRLRKFLSSGESLERNVPRGHYLNVVV